MTTIPKVIHYCWFGNGLIPASQQKCIDSWRKYMPDYTIKRWNENNFDVNQYEFTRDAYKYKKWSFITDVVRLKALYEEGGIYMDTDVELFDSLDQFAYCDFFSGIECYPEHYTYYANLLDENYLPKDRNNIYSGSLAILAAVLGSKSGNPLIKQCLEYFISSPFVFADGSLNTKIINPAVIAHYAIDYGFRYIDEEQHLNVPTTRDGDWLILPSTKFLCWEHAVSEKPILQHHSAQSWVPKTKRETFYLYLDKLHLYEMYLSLRKIKNKILKK